MRRKPPPCLARHGPSRLFTAAPVCFWRIAAEEVTEPMILLLVAGFFYQLLGELRDALTIFAIILTLVAVEVGNEFRAKRAIAVLERAAALPRPWATPLSPSHKTGTFTESRLQVAGVRPLEREASNRQCARGAVGARVRFAGAGHRRTLARPRHDAARGRDCAVRQPDNGR